MLLLSRVSRVRLCVNTKLGELLVCLLPLLLKPPFALLPLDLLVGCVQTRQAGVSELEDWVPSISTLSWEGMLVRGPESRYRVQFTWGQGWRTH